MAKRLPQILHNIFRSANKKEKYTYLEKITDPHSIKVIKYQDEYNLITYQGRRGLQLRGTMTFLEIKRHKQKKINGNQPIQKKTLDLLFTGINQANLEVIVLKPEYPEKITILEDRPEYQIIKYFNFDGIRIKGTEANDTVFILAWPDKREKKDEDNPNIY